MSDNTNNNKNRNNKNSGNTQVKFVPLGQVVATPGALAALSAAGVAPTGYLDRHARGDWGEALPHHDKIANDQALRYGERLLSAYRLPGTGVKLWIITEWDRSVTTLLLPDEY